LLLPSLWPGLAAARTLLDPTAPPYADIPWYWSDQYDLRLQVAGVSIGDEEIVRGEATPGSKFSLIQLHRGRVVGVSCMNNAREFSSLKRLLGNVALPDRAALANPGMDLRKLLVQ
jgi:3-phenylpropionate/trans-cinnamate dioxygenase ferredoxin reductase subunit